MYSSLKPITHRLGLLMTSSLVAVSGYAQVGVGGAGIYSSSGYSGAVDATAASAQPMPGTQTGTLRNTLPSFDQATPAQRYAQPAPAPGAEFPPVEGTRAIQVRRTPNQFQRFVKDATGQDLEVFGSNLFTTPNTYTPVTNIAPPDNYTLGAGDEVQLQVWGAIDQNLRLTVDRSGKVQIPRVGAVSLAGVSAGQLSGVLKSHMTKVFTNIEVSATVSRLRSIQVYVVGQAERPGTYTLSSLSTLVNALFASGGPSANGSMRSIELRRRNELVSTIDLYTFIAKGDKAADVTLQPGDVIVVPPVGPRVALTGAYDQAAIYELVDTKKGGTTVRQLLSIGGGVPALATLQKAQLERVSPQSNPPRQVAEIALNAIGLGTPLQDGDILTLIGITQGFGNAVTLKGNVAYPLRHAWKPGMRVLDLIPEPEALITQDYYRKQNQQVQVIDDESTRFIRRKGSQTVGGGQYADAASSEDMRTRQPYDDAQQQRETVSQRDGDQRDQRDQGARVKDTVRQFKANFDAINWDYAVVERLNKATLVNQLIPFNLGKAVLSKDPEHNLLLQAGDVVTIFSQKDIRLPAEKQLRLVRVEGEVAAPGVYPSLPGETLPQLLRRIGGLTPQAFLFGTEFTRESVRQQQQKNLDQLVSRLETASSSQSSAQVANLSGDQALRANAIIEAQRQRQQQQISRLKTQRSNGRVALEMPTDKADLASLPPLLLEDGDSVYVPATPSFVAAYGAVNNDNVIVYKPGRVVADVSRLAGLTEDADVNQSFVLRADGTVISRKDRSGLLGGGFDSTPLLPGDTLVVPPKVDRETFWTAFIRNAKDITQILANLGLGVAALRSL